MVSVFYTISTLLRYVGELELWSIKRSFCFHIQFSSFHLEKKLLGPRPFKVVLVPLCFIHWPLISSGLSFQWKMILVTSL